MYRWTNKPILGLLAASILTGCSGGTGKGEASSLSAESDPTTVYVDESPARRAGLLPDSRPLIGDLAIPTGFSLVESISRQYESSSGRYADLTYEGRASKDAVDRFYKGQMPAHGWTQRSAEMVRGTFTLHFEKDGEDAIIRITDADRRSNQYTGTSIHIDLHPVKN